MSLKFRQAVSGLEASTGFSAAKRSRLREIRPQLHSYSADNPAKALIFIHIAFFHGSRSLRRATLQPPLPGLAHGGCPHGVRLRIPSLR